MGFLLLVVPCLIAGVHALDLAGSPSMISESPLPLPSPPHTNPPPSNLSTPLLNFNDIPQQLTTCEPATFNWTYSGSAAQQLIISIITDQGVSFNNGTTTPIVNRVISSTVKPNLDTYTWPAVDVPQGWYRLYAIVPAGSFNTSSAPFFVNTGSDVSCLLSLSSSDTASSSSGPSTNVTAIVGGLLGGLALLLCTAIILLLYRRQRLDRAESRNVYSTDERRRSRGGKSLSFSARPTSWDNLGSVDTHVSTAAPKNSYSSQRLRHQHRHLISQTSFSGSVNLPVLEYGRNPYQENGSRYSDIPRSRKPSDTSSLEASTALDHIVGPVLDIGPPSYRSPSPTQTVASSPEAGNALSPKVRISRKGSRKPVPAYDPTADAFLSSSAPAPSTLDAVDTTLIQVADDPPARPLPAALIHKDSTASLEVFGGFNSAPASAHGHGHYISRSQSTSSRKDKGLTHKNSFGGFESRPMHYLIPDMPLPQK